MPDGDDQVITHLTDNQEIRLSVSVSLIDDVELGWFRRPSTHPDSGIVELRTATGQLTIHATAAQLTRLITQLELAHTALFFGAP